LSVRTIARLMGVSVMAVSRYINTSEI